MPGRRRTDTTVAPSGEMSNDAASKREAAHLRLEVARLGDPILALRHAGREQPPVPRTEVVVPVADRVVLEQQRLHAGVAASLLARLVLGEVGGTAVDHARRRRRPGRSGRPRARPRRRREPRGAAPRRRPGQQPERVDRVRVLARRRLRVGVRPRRGEQQRAVGEECRPAASPAAERVSRRAGAAPAGSTCHSEVAIFLPSGATPPTATTRRSPSGLRRSDERRGSWSMRSIVNGSVMGQIIAASGALRGCRLRDSSESNICTIRA